MTQPYEVSQLEEYTKECNRIDFVPFSRDQIDPRSHYWFIISRPRFLDTLSIFYFVFQLMLVPDIIILLKIDVLILEKSTLTSVGSLLSNFREKVVLHSPCL